MGSAGLCVVLGVALLVIGAYFLLFAPGLAGEASINLHRVSIGQAFFIAGAVLLAAGIRPRTAGHADVRSLPR